MFARRAASAFAFGVIALLGRVHATNLVPNQNFEDNTPSTPRCCSARSSVGYLDQATTQPPDARLPGAGALTCEAP